MTYLDKYKEEHPGLSDEEYQRIVREDCPIDKDGNTIRCPSSSMVRPGISTTCPVCWNQEIPGTKPTNNTNEREDGNMNKNFTKGDLKIGYIVKQRDGELRMVMETRNDGTVLVKNDGWFLALNGYSDDLTHKGDADGGWTIMEVYGYRGHGGGACNISTANRELLWKREEKTCDNCAHKVVCTHVGMCEHYMEKEASK